MYSHPLFCNVLKNRSQRIISMLFLLVSGTLYGSNATRMIIFSYDRPLQLYALLESIQTYVSGIESTHVIYRTSNDRFEHAYTAVMQQFFHVHYIKQNAAIHSHFKEITEQAMQNNAPPYVIFAVDDIIVTDYIDLSEGAALLEQANAYGLYLRLGANLNHCYTLNRPQPLPTFKHISSDMISWQFSHGAYDWNYPNTVDMTLYRTADVIHALKNCSYRSPNQLEAAWSSQLQYIKNRCGICYIHSKMVNVPCNRVQHDFTQNLYNVSNDNDVDATALLTLFEQGYRINIAPFFKVHNTAAHQEYNFNYIRH